MEITNFVKVTGLLHLIKGRMEDENQDGRYVQFSVKQDTKRDDGRTRHDFLILRAYDPEIGKWVKQQQEGSFVSVEGEVKSSLGSGNMYILVNRIEAL